MIGRALLAIPTLLTPLGPVRDEPLELARVDGSAYPAVVVDLVTPLRLSARRITAAMVDVDGAAVESVNPIDPRDVVVGLVIDDRPATASAVVTELQGAAVELVRNASDGIQISLGTPSGLRTALTADRGANIARIAGITAGAPAVLPLPDVLLETIAELASSSADDRHAVVALSGAAGANKARLEPLTEALAESGTTLHVLAPEDVTAGALARIAADTGGSTRRAPEMLASMDGVTATISQRYRVTARLTEPGDHRIRLTVDGERFAARFAVAAAGPPAPAPTEAQTEPPVEDAATGRATTSPSQLTVRPSTGGGGLPVRTIGLGVIALAAAVLLGSVGAFLFRRRGGRDEREMMIVKKPAVAAVTPSSTATVPAANPKPAPERPPPPRSAPPPSRAPSDMRPKPARLPPARRPEVTPRPRQPAPEPTTDTSDWIVAGDVRVSLIRGEVWCGDRQVELSPAELRILELLMRNGDRGVTRDEIIEVGQLDESDGRDSVDAIVAQVRRKTGVRGRRNVVRKERVVTYFLEGADADPEA